MIDSLPPYFRRYAGARCTDMTFWEKRIEVSCRDALRCLAKAKMPRFDGIAFFSRFRENACYARSTIRPIFNEMKRRGFRARWTTKPIDNGTRWLYVSSVTPVPKEIRAHTVYVPHGVGQEGPSPWNLECIKCLLPGPYYFNLFARRPFRRNQLITIGFPKSDILFSSNRKLVMKKTKEKFHLDLPYDKTILYAPSWDWWTCNVKQSNAFH